MASPTRHRMYMNVLYCLLHFNTSIATRQKFRLESDGLLDPKNATHQIWAQWPSSGYHVDITLLIDFILLSHVGDNHAHLCWWYPLTFTLPGKKFGGFLGIGGKTRVAKGGWRWDWRVTLSLVQIVVTCEPAVMMIQKLTDICSSQPPDLMW